MLVDSSNHDSGTPGVSKSVTNVCMCVAFRVGDTTVISVCQTMMMLLLCCYREMGQSTSFSRRQTVTGPTADIYTEGVTHNAESRKKTHSHTELLSLLKCVSLFKQIQK